MKTYCLSVILFFTMPVLSHAQKETPLRLVQTIPLPDLKEGDFDHFTVDLEGHRLFLTAEKNSAVLALEKSGPRLFVNITGLNSVGVFDREKRSSLPEFHRRCHRAEWRRKDHSAAWLGGALASGSWHCFLGRQGYTGIFQVSSTA